MLKALLASASDLLASSLEPQDAVRGVVRLVVPALADWSILTLLEDTAEAESWHRDPGARHLVAQLAARREDRRRGPVARQVIETGEPFFMADGVEAYAEQTFTSREAVRAFERLEVGSVAVVPMFSGDRVFATITLGRGRDRSAITGAEVGVAVDVARRASVHLHNVRSFDAQRKLAEQLQRSMLSAPVQPDHVEIIYRYAPAVVTAEIGGDWYDAFTQPDGGTVAVVGDVAGHDTVAAATMGQIRSILRGIAVTTGSGPARLLHDVDKALQTLMFETTASAVIARLEQDDEQLERGVTSVRYSNAGHPPPLLVHADGRVQLLHHHDLLLGVDPAVERTERVVELARGATLLLYSDGLVERRHEPLDVGLDRLSRAVALLAQEDLPELVDGIIAHLLPDQCPEDDVAVIALRLHDQDRPRPDSAPESRTPPNVPDDKADS